MLRFVKTLFVLATTLQSGAIIFAEEPTGDQQMCYLNATDDRACVEFNGILAQQQKHSAMQAKTEARLQRDEDKKTTGASEAPHSSQ